MKPLPQKYKLLREIGDLLEKYLKSRYTAVEINATELYEVVTKDPGLKTKFPDPKLFNQFLRKHHQSQLLSSFLEYDADTSDHHRYKWSFRSSKKREVKDSVYNETIEGTYNYYKNSKNVLAADGTRLNSKQEVYIYEQLKKCSHLLVKIEFPINRLGDTKFVDFMVKNKLNGNEFLWEHFGMTNNEAYKNTMTEKIAWYKNNGIRPVENKGTLIYTYYTTEHNFKKEVDRYIQIILH